MVNSDYQQVPEFDRTKAITPCTIMRTKINKFSYRSVPVVVLVSTHHIRVSDKRIKMGIIYSHILSLTRPAKKTILMDLV